MLEKGYELKHTLIQGLATTLCNTKTSNDYNTSTRPDR
jgi:hypothetical protein